jgi:hypothetical protein
VDKKRLRRHKKIKRQTTTPSGNARQHTAQSPTKYSLMLRDSDKSSFSIMSSAEVGSNMSTTRSFFNRVNTTNYKLKRGVSEIEKKLRWIFQKG